MLILLAKRESSTARPLMRLFEFFVPHVKTVYIFTDEGHDLENLRIALAEACRGVLMVDLRGFTEEDIVGRFTSGLEPPRLLILYGPSAHRLNKKVQRWVRGSQVGGRVRSTVRLDLTEILEHLLPILGNAQ